jgi:outer membrane protein TolC
VPDFLSWLNRYRLPSLALAGAALTTTVLCGGDLSAQTIERVTFDEAVRRAMERNPGVAQAAQAILRAETLLQQARIVYQPTVTASVTTSILDSARGFNDLVTQPQTQSQLAASVSYPVLAAARWAQRAQAEYHFLVARLIVE